jgi:transposase
MRSGLSLTEKIKRGFDPALGYVVFERPDVQAGEKGFREILEILRKFEWEGQERGVFQDGANGRTLLAIQFDPGLIDRVKSDLVNAGLPDDVVFSVYGKSRSR